MKLFLISLSFFAVSVFITGCKLSEATALQQNQVIPGNTRGNGICLNPEEIALLVALQSYRQEHKLPAIPLSVSLTKVAQIHCRDLAWNQPHRPQRCNMHSWSNKGPWTPCCYTNDHREAECMWNKPAELTVYTGAGYEIAFYSNAVYENAEAFANDAIQSWSRSQGHNAVILNKGIWSDAHWQAVGVGYYRGYATIWFGMEPDPDQTVLHPCL